MRVTNGSGERELLWLVGLFLAVKLIFLFVLAVNSQYLMDEYAIAYETRILDQALYREVWPARTLLYAVFFKPATWLGTDSVEIMRLARLESALLALPTLALLYGVARNLGRDRLEALFVLCVALSVSSFLEWIFAVRPEPPGLFFATATLYVATRPGTDGGERMGPGPAACLLAGLLCGLAFLTTQKAVYFDVALGLGLVGAGLLRHAPGRAVAWGALLVAGWAVALGGYVGYFALQGAEPFALLRHIFLGPTVENATAGHLTYAEDGDALRNFVYVSLLRNPVAYALGIGGLLVALYGIGRRTTAERIALIFAAAVALFVLVVHRAPWPYNFVWPAPFLALWAPEILRLAWRAIGRRSVPVFAATVLVLAVSFQRNVAYLAHDNAFQNETVRRAEALLEPGERYFDGVFMVATREHATGLWLQVSAVRAIREAAAAGEPTRLEAVFALEPEVVIRSYRTESIAEALAPYLEERYRPAAPNILVRTENGEAAPPEPLAAEYRPLFPAAHSF